MAQRFKCSGKAQLVLLVLSDFDPEGEDIGHSFARSMRDDFRIRSIDFIKVRAHQRPGKRVAVAAWTEGQGG